ncbi:terminase family protein [Mycobacterium sp. SMC-8]|uniref:terminase large subunit domain-containing protein n=1 Tax=Mycobacterium sp. SMC-8 TaxID=2857060 RepID=UPI0021B1C692|nr:terminase family protein [Mycobacterium sp. SMC-8]UXA10760.1 terminase family protein [Mycobacterium sp. SMC-8]
MSTALRTLVGIRALAAHRARRRPTTPAELAKRMIPGYRITPTIALISDAIADAVANPDRRYIISTPPRTGKSVLTSQVGTVFALASNPDAMIILRSYSDSLAEEHSRAARRLIEDHGGVLGVALSTEKASVGRWQLANRRGGLLAGGILSGATGFGADLLIVDDPIKNSVEADSAAYRRRLSAEFRASLLSRLHPGASVVIVATRWAEEDLSGELLAEDGTRWQHVNVPAISTPGVPDALDREPGVGMTTALGERSVGDFEEIRRAVGSRAWAALYLGVPSTPEGTLIRADWLETWRLPAAPPRPIRTVVGVDPSDSGSGDSCGIVAASISSDGTVAVIADASAPLTSEQWARAAVELAIDTGASEIAVEGFAARETYVRVVKDALARYRMNHPIRVTSWPPKGSGRGGGDALARSSALLQGLEVGTVRIAGHLPELEDAAVGWQVGQHQPDQLAALVVAHDVLVHSLAQQVTFTNPAARGGLRDRGDTRSPIEQRLGGRPGLASVTPINPRLTRRISGGGYDPLGYQRTTRRSF